MKKGSLILRLFTIILLVTVFANAQVQGQRGNYGQMGQSQNRGQSQMPSFDASNAVGILTYDEEKVAKRSKIKSDGKKKDITVIISAYNHRIDEIRILYAVLLITTEKYVADRRKEAMARRNREAMSLIQSDAMDKLRPVRREVIKADKELNKRLAGILSEKQLKKWKNYQNSKKESLRPKIPESRSNTYKGASQRNF